MAPATRDRRHVVLYPLSYASTKVEGAAGFEPATTRLQACSAARHSPGWSRSGRQGRRDGAIRPEAGPACGGSRLPGSRRGGAVVPSAFAPVSGFRRQGLAGRFPELRACARRGSNPRRPGCPGALPVVLPAFAGHFTPARRAPVKTLQRRRGWTKPDGPARARERMPRRSRTYQTIQLWWRCSSVRHSPLQFWPWRQGTKETTRYQRDT